MSKKVTQGTMVAKLDLMGGMWKPRNVRVREYVPVEDRSTVHTEGE